MNTRPRRLPIVGVMGSGSDAHESLAMPLGIELARLGVHLLTGGGGGVMEAVSRAFFETSPRDGLVIGIVPGSVRDDCYSTKPGYPNRYVEIPIRTHLPLSGKQGTDPLSRNHINILTADIIVALPGGPGTASEIRLAIRYRKPLIVFHDPAEDSRQTLPEEVRVTTSLESVIAFVKATIDSLQ